MSSEKRRGTRVKADFEAYVTVGDVVIPVSTRNLSLKGALLDGCEDCLMGTACELNIPLAPGLRIVVEGEVVRVGESGVGMVFKEMDDLSFATLHRLVQLNADDPEAIDEELGRFPGVDG
ncbi:PilZ domain-containing protein [Pseudodesulfovibrio sp.]|uniref:PilZ domain-containing protein n=1 Tax=Pseudodesulfovibrio sp. TaxID=2035812 RepID=UPI00263842B4|nr:PilZ domain-containing protein [Pseudodesulfovibrio sp.]MDD3311036.1 PilZ domain-containing protein [Pseudodesulfovibrio sp.]